MREDAVLREISQGVEWGGEEDEEDIQNIQSSFTPIPSNILDFTPPDSGFLQTAVEESDIHNVIELIEMSNVETKLSIDNSKIFLDLEAVENLSLNPPPRRKRRNLVTSC